ncbi:MAG: L,D-transpeptidase family protein [Gammaproteobacteria bacterium]|nr:L,D-transpeptidase family protein [Gammaproteobacteria bacterium]MBU1624876.1 L,D-transpeptidase family protein [Gammaproteobacteria bacterium]MBU1982720.1 L,D-transpeptidase family protein [Gammaproteobacteria bacterium]
MKTRLPHLLLLLPFIGLAANAEPDSRDMEQLLARSLQAVGDNRLDVALNEVDSLLRINPNFKLAQLVKGDLLLARSRSINEFGDAPNAPRDRVQDLREEAQVRLHRAQQQQPIAVPRYLWQLNAKQRHAVVVDTSKSTLYLYENVNGEPRYVADFYISMGKKGADKVIEGDQKTPLGVYFVDGYIPRHKLADLYGSGAYPISYPNEWDRRQGRNGHGIWVHGTPSGTYSRPPRASNGCVVLSNADLQQLGHSIEVGTTPVIITNGIDWLSTSDSLERESLLQSIEQWRIDWESRDTEKYLSHYADDFNTGKTALTDFAVHKRLVNSGKSWIKVKVENLSLFPYPTQQDLVVVDFEQAYDSNNLTNRMHKRQYWQKREGRWQIVYEGAA